MTTWADLYGPLADQARTALESGPVVISGAPGSGRAELAAELAADWVQVDVWPHAAGTVAGLRNDLARSMLGALAPPGASVADSDYVLQVAALFGSRAPAAHALVEGREASKLSLGDVIDAVPREVFLVVHDAHLLAESWAARALWRFRRRCQRPDSPRLVLITRPWHTEALTGPEAPFLGFARTVALLAPKPERWFRVAPPGLERGDIAWLLEQTLGMPGPTFAVLERAGAERRAVSSAWTEHVRDSREMALSVDRLAYGLHPYGPRLLRAIAAKRPAYPAVPAARTDRIATALRALRNQDLIYQPRPRQWALADPAWAPHLAGLAATSRP